MQTSEILQQGLSSFPLVDSQISMQIGLGKNSWKPTWAREKRKPAFMALDEPVELPYFGPPHCLWGYTPAFDLLRIEKNEGDSYAQDLDLLFAASGDPRNLMLTVNGLPTTYEATMNCILNDISIRVVARNIVMLLLAAQLPPVEAAEVILHVWYSARLTKGMSAVIDKCVRHRIAGVTFKIKDQSDTALLAKTWTFGSTVIAVRLTKAHWGVVLTMLDAKHDLAKSEEQRRKVILAPHRLDYREHRLLFDENDGTWLQMDCADPRAGWPAHSILSALHTDRSPRNDTNGLLYFHIRSIIERFCQKVQNPVHNLNLVLYCGDAASLPKQLGGKARFTGFDRVEVGHVVDHAWLGLSHTLKTFAPLLKKRVLNPRAALVALFLNACEEAARVMDIQSNVGEPTSRMNRALEYLSLDNGGMIAPNSPQMMTIATAMDLLKDYDRIFAWYMDRFKFDACSKHFGLQMRVQNSVVEAWPMRLKKKFGEEGAKEEFQDLLSSPFQEVERFVEWVREA
ncbi:MAG: hypothetical protein Q9168_004686 [Polycauliona sp. 1 TL-2023]